MKPILGGISTIPGRAPTFHLVFLAGYKTCAARFQTDWYSGACLKMISLNPFKLNNSWTIFG